MEAPEMAILLYVVELKSIVDSQRKVRAGVPPDSRADAEKILCCRHGLSTFPVMSPAIIAKSQELEEIPLAALIKAIEELEIGAGGIVCIEGMFEVAPDCVIASQSKLFARQQRSCSPLAAGEERESPAGMKLIEVGKLHFAIGKVHRRPLSQRLITGFRLVWQEGEGGIVHFPFQREVVRTDLILQRVDGRDRGDLDCFRHEWSQILKKEVAVHTLVIESERELVEKGGVEGFEGDRIVEACLPILSFALEVGNFWMDAGISPKEGEDMLPREVGVIFGKEGEKLMGPWSEGGLDRQKVADPEGVAPIASRKKADAARGLNPRILHASIETERKALLGQKFHIGGALGGSGNKDDGRVVKGVAIGPGCII